MTEASSKSSQTLRLVEEYISKEQPPVSTQEILDSGAIPKLLGYIVQPGKVSDSIYGGHGTFKDKQTGKRIEFNNPPLNTTDDVPIRIMVRTPRISTHDINRGEIPLKDQILAENHNYMRRMLSGSLGTSQFEVEGLKDNSVVIAAENLTQIPFENVLRAFMATSTTDTNMGNQYLNKGVRYFGGHNLPEGLTANCELPYVMDTPSTKSEKHDKTVDHRFLFDNRICTPQQYTQIRNSSLFAFGIVSQFLIDRGLIAVDTKTEHGINKNGEIVSQDEIWTMDSSRFWLADDYNSQLAKLQSGEITELNPQSYSKEFARGFSKGDQEYTDEQRALIAVRYIEGIQHLLGTTFTPDTRPRDQRIISGIETILERLAA